MLIITQCGKCKHRIDRNTCQAFPNGIPIDLRREVLQHNTPLPDQENNIVYEIVDEYKQMDEDIKNTPNWRDRYIL